MNSAAPLLTTPTERLHLAWYILKSAAAAEIGPAAEAAAPAIKEEAKNIFRRLWGYTKSAPAWLGHQVDQHPRTALGLGLTAGGAAGAGFGAAMNRPDPSMIDQASHWIHEHPGTTAAGAGLLGAGGLAALIGHQRRSRRRSDDE